MNGSGDSWVANVKKKNPRNLTILKQAFLLEKNDLRYAADLRNGFHGKLCNRKHEGVRWTRPTRGEKIRISGSKNRPHLKFANFHDLWFFFLRIRFADPRCDGEAAIRKVGRTDDWADGNCDCAKTIERSARLVGAEWIQSGKVFREMNFWEKENMLTHR